MAFLLNPPYKNTDENQKIRVETESHYQIHPSIMELTGEDAGKERYLAFLGQILNICKLQNTQNHELKPIVMIFTPTSWLIPRPTYVNFRKIWDEHFRFHSGFIITSNEFFSISGKWPLAFTIWNYEQDEEAMLNNLQVNDLTHLKKIDLNLNWNSTDENLFPELNKIIENSKQVRLDNSRGDIRSTLDYVYRREKLIIQPRYDFSTAKKEKDFGKVVSGFPIKDIYNQFTLKRKCGSPVGSFLGFMDDNTPVRLLQDSCLRMSLNPDRIWFRLDSSFKDINKLKCFNAPTDNRSYCAYNLISAKPTISWFCITKSINGIYPVWANQYDLWPPNIKQELEKYWYSLCFAFVLAENRCIVTKFEKDNPVAGAPEIFVDNPLCPANKESFWSTTLDKEIVSEPLLAKELVDKIKELYQTWNRNYCKGQFLYNVGLQNEPYFKFFDYADFLTPYSGLIQIRKYAEQEGKKDLLDLFSEIQQLTKKVKGEIYRLLVDEFGYFE